MNETNHFAITCRHVVTNPENQFQITPFECPILRHRFTEQDIFISEDQDVAACKLGNNLLHAADYQENFWDKIFLENLNFFSPEKSDIDFKVGASTGVTAGVYSSYSWKEDMHVIKWMGGTGNSC